MRMEHRPERNRFVMPVEGGEAFIEYTQRPSGTLDLQHTIVPEEVQGEGVGSALVEQVLEHARANGMKVIPSCPFIQHWLRENPGYDDVLAQG